MWNSISKFFIDNQSSIIVSLIIGAIFFILGPLGLWFSGKKVKHEKIKKAKDEFLDLIESMLVNNENFSRSKILTLFRAIERQNGISLELDSDIENLLEDLSLRFARSKHLSAEQKDEYASRIDKLIINLNEKPDQETKENSLTREREIPKSIKSIINELKTESENLNSDSLKEIIEKLEKYHKRPSDPLLLAVRVIREEPRFFLSVLVVYIIIVALLVYFDLLK
ncbi:hypothetical protein ACQKCH_16005 [Nubsella zeaxanthinifaciens]|uniref:hypothetical protein n=1 Tax=Nubsella zeaxanthinifaciens TaxID=392412 RepID=UPI003CFE8945